MKKMLKKSEVLREGYIKGLKEAQRVINEQLFGYGLVKDGTYTLDQMMANITQELIDDLQKLKAAIENEQGEVKRNSIDNQWNNVFHGYNHLREYMEKFFGVRLKR